jgi:hypothetical protein
MPVLLGLVIGFLVWAGFWMFVGPIIALLNFIVGRFFIASVLMTISLWCATFFLETLKITSEEYEVLLGFGLVLEGVKWGIKVWWQARKSSTVGLVINVVDDDEQPVMRDITPHARRIR